MRSSRLVIALAAAAVVLTGCQVPRFQGPEIQDPPPGFQRQPDNYPPRRVFPDQPVALHSGWVHSDVEGVSIIYIDGHPMAMGPNEIVAARDAAEAADMVPDANYGEVEALTIDGRDAFGWYRTVQSPRRGLVEVTYTAVVPYDTMTYAIHFTSGEPSLKRASPDTLRAVVTSFAIGRTTYNMPLIAIIFGSLLLAVSMVKAKRKERADRLRSINLVTIKKDEEEQADPQEKGEATGAGYPPPVP